MDEYEEYDIPELDISKLKSGKDPGGIKNIRDMILYLVLVIAALFVVYNFVAQQIEVSGSSMESTLHSKDRLILEKLSYRFGDPKRFDIIVFKPYSKEKDTYYIKRIIGLPGETIQILDGDIYINGSLLPEGYGNGKMIDGGLASDAITLLDDEYFVLGDNRNGSRDSREIGTVKRSSIIGRAFMRIWPIQKLVILKHQ